MRPRPSSKYTIGLAIIIALGAASQALAQADTTKKRVPVTKEQPAAPTRAPAGVPVTKEPAAIPVTKEPVAARPDTTPRVATGEVATPKDTAVAVTPAPKCTTPSCGEVAQVVQPRSKVTRYLIGNGFYIGVGAGTTVPINTFSDLGYDSGFNLTIPIGWQRPEHAFGIRATLGYDQPNAHYYGNQAPLPANVGSAPDPKIYSGTLDATFKFPVGGAVRGGRGLSLYALGGGGAYLFRGFGGAAQLADALGGDKVGSSQKNIHKWGVQAGAGAEYGLGPAAVFFETRWVNVFTNGSNNGNKYLRWMPIGVGVTLR